MPPNLPEHWHRHGRAIKRLAQKLSASRFRIPTARKRANEAFIDLLYPLDRISTAGSIA
jgi:hypothetical protein